MPLLSSIYKYLQIIVIVTQKQNLFSYKSHLLKVFIMV